jgi:hypothetical protein
MSLLAAHTGRAMMMTTMNLAVSSIIDGQQQRRINQTPRDFIIASLIERTHPSIFVYFKY